MNYRTYTPHTPSVSELGMGTWQLGANTGWRELSAQQATRMVHTALDAGVNFFDTAPNYGQGSSERRLGKALKNADRSAIVINTKFGHTVEGDIKFELDTIQSSIEGSLRRLQLDYLDSAIFHNPPRAYLDGNKADAHYELLERMVEAGKIKAYGASLDTYEDIKLFLETTNGSVVEAFFNILHQDTARSFGLAREKEAGVIVKIPLDSGWLSGKYSAYSTFQGVRSRWSRTDIETRAQLVEDLKQLIGPDIKLSQAAVAFCLAYDSVSTVIPGSTTVDQLQSNLSGLDKPLSASLVSKLNRFFEQKVKPLQLPW